MNNDTCLGKFSYRLHTYNDIKDNEVFKFGLRLVFTLDTELAHDPVIHQSASSHYVNKLYKDSMQ